METTALVLNSITAQSGVQYQLNDIALMVKNRQSAALTKRMRPAVFATVSTLRPVGKDDSVFANWNGLQVFDIDIKDEYLATRLKPGVFEALKHYAWLFMVASSTSGNGLHIYTADNTAPRTREGYVASFSSKADAVWKALVSAARSASTGTSDVKLMSFIDTAMFRPQQGVFVTADAGVLINDNFDANERCECAVSPAMANYLESCVAGCLAREEARSEIYSVDLAGADFSNVPHIKYDMRWRVINTLVAALGEQPAREAARKMFSKTPWREIDANITTAVKYSKPVSPAAISWLKEHTGIRIEVDDDIDIPQAEKEDESLKDGVFNLQPGEYIGNILDKGLSDILKARRVHIVAPPGSGKTEMVKRLLETERIILVLPFISVIKNKLLYDGDYDELLQSGEAHIAYGSHLPKLSSDVRISVMTFDKFARLDMNDKRIAEFDRIIIDESHLVFTSMYRSCVAGISRNITLAPGKVTLMTGTPFAERVFSPDVVRCDIRKKEDRIKRAKCVLVHTEADILPYMSKRIADCVKSRRKVLVPTNKGNAFYSAAVSGAATLLGDVAEIRSCYYKRSNSNEDYVEMINKEKTVGEYNVVFATTYLSVGVDINDMEDFLVLIGEDMIPGDMVQFACRLRKADIDIEFIRPRVVGRKKVELNKAEPFSYSESRMIVSKDETGNVTETPIYEYYENSVSTMASYCKYTSSKTVDMVFKTLCLSFPWIVYDKQTNTVSGDLRMYDMFMYYTFYKEYLEQLPITLRELRNYGYELSVEKAEILEPDARDAVASAIEDAKAAIKAMKREIASEIVEYIDKTGEDGLSRLCDENEMVVSDFTDFAASPAQVPDTDLVIKTARQLRKIYKLCGWEVTKETAEACKNDDGAIEMSKLRKWADLAAVVHAETNMYISERLEDFIYKCRELAEKSASWEKPDWELASTEVILSVSRSEEPLVRKKEIAAYTKLMETVLDVRKNGKKVKVGIADISTESYAVLSKLLNVGDGLIKTIA